MTLRRTYKDYLQDILVAATHAVEFIADTSLEAFSDDVQKVYAVTRALEIIGEAARRIPPSVQAAHPHLPWQEMIGMRNMVIHEYFGVDTEVLRRTVQEDLPPLRGSGCYPRSHIGSASFEPLGCPPSTASPGGLRQPDIGLYLMGGQILLAFSALVRSRDLMGVATAGYKESS